MSTVLGGIQVILAVVLIAAAGGKLVRGPELVGALRLSGVPQRFARVLSPLVPAVELVIGTLLLITRGVALSLSLASAALLLTAFSGWLVWVRAKRLGVRCGCFGASNNEVTGATIARNVVLVAAAATGSIVATGEASPLPEVNVYYLMAVGCLTAIVLLGAAFNQVRPHLVLSLEQMKRRRDMASGIEV